MYLSLFLKGLLLGFCIAAPVGPVGILCINRTLNKGYISGLVTGLGATTADLLFGLIVVLGLNFVSDFLIDYETWFHFFGFLFLVMVGVQIMRKKKRTVEPALQENGNLLRDYVSSFILTLSNPLTIIFFIAVFAFVGISDVKPLGAVVLLFSILLGSGGWWLLLCGIAHKYKTKLGEKMLAKVDLISGLAIVAFALFVGIKWALGVI
ncbi:MAG TPA: LysE family transporter [Bacteroidales bacterium]|nr:LysE family transporter [Bacteroidales bacterium]